MILAAMTTMASCTHQAEKFDEDGMLLDSMVIMTADGSIVARDLFTYDSDSNLISYTELCRSRFNDGMDTTEQVITTYDTIGNELTTILIQRDDTVTTRNETEYTYDTAHRRSGCNIRQTGDEGEIVQRTEFKYDAQGNHIETTGYMLEGEDWIADSRIVNSYDEAGRATGAELQINVGDTAEWQSISGERYTYDTEGWLTERTETAYGQKVRSEMKYDEAGNLTTMQTYSYNEAEDKWEPMELTITTYGEKEKKEQVFAYTDDGEMGLECTRMYYYR